MLPTQSDKEPIQLPLQKYIYFLTSTLGHPKKIFQKFSSNN